jgi:stearoyl-CoA desaturase (delta-9 desaturase)
MTSAEPLANPELHDVPSAATGAEPRVELPLPPSRRVGEGIDWARIWPFLVLQASCLLVFVVGWSPVAVITCVALYLVRMFGITAFYHRYFSHRTFRVGRGMQFVGALLGAAATQRGPLWWAAHHRQHHRHSDTPQDAHSPIAHGFWWAHIGWIACRRNYATDLDQVRDLARFPELRWLDRNDLVVPFALLGGLLLFGWGLEAWAPSLGADALQMGVWGFSVSTTLLFHATASINSLAHLIGKRVWPTKDKSRNSMALALLTLGEGWHNNHHWCPGTARQGFRWWEIDLSYYALVALSWVGLVHDLRPIPARARDEARRIRGGRAPRPSSAPAGRVSRSSAPASPDWSPPSGWRARTT